MFTASSSWGPRPAILDCVRQSMGKLCSPAMCSSWLHLLCTCLTGGDCDCLFALSTCRRSSLCPHDPHHRGVLHGARDLELLGAVLAWVGLRHFPVVGINRRWVLLLSCACLVEIVGWIAVCFMLRVGVAGVFPWLSGGWASIARCTDFQHCWSTTLRSWLRSW